MDYISSFAHFGGGLTVMATSHGVRVAGMSRHFGS
jgi:hypothetical protein